MNGEPASLPKEDEGKRIWIEFGGVYRDSLVYVNNCLVGRQPRGYSAFRYDITDVANYAAGTQLLSASTPQNSKDGSMKALEFIVMYGW